MLKNCTNEKIGELAWLMAPLHSADRTVEKGNLGAFENKVDELITHAFVSREKALVIGGVSLDTQN